jgi:hypothetical protein
MTALASVLGGALAMFICAGCGDSSSAPVDVGGADATTTIVADAAPSETTDDAAVVDAFVPYDAGCATQLAKLNAAYTGNSCSLCIQRSCTFFTTPCSMDCKCVEATLALLTCIQVAADRTQCLAEARSSYSPDQVNQLLVCDGMCDTECGGAGGDDASSPSADASNDGGDAS